MKAADIPDEVFAQAVREHRRGDPGWAQCWDVYPAISKALGADVPAKVCQAKARKLIARGVIDGCACGCRGDFRIPAEVTPLRLDATWSDPR